MRMSRAQGITVSDLDVVVVDDSKPIQTILRTILNGVRVSRVRTFDSALAAYEAMVVEPPNLLFTDWCMPGTDGLQLVRRMRSPRAGALSTVPAVLITGHATRDLIQQSIDSGIHFVLAKPLSPANVTKRIEAVIADHRQFVLDEELGILVLEDRAQRIAGARARRSWLDPRRHLAEARQAAAAAAAAPAGPRATSPTTDSPQAAAPLPAATHGEPRTPAGFAAPIRRGSVETATGQARSLTA
jgi:CheY-like chemotaxis protein